MNNVKNIIKKNFTIAPNKLINDNQISDRARFLFIYMCSKSDEWVFYNKKLCIDLGYSIDTLRKYIKELIKTGWVLKESQKSISGRFTANSYVLNDKPNKKLPCRKNTHTVKNQARKIPTHSNKDLSKKNNKKRNNIII